jgi:flagellar biosynthetic protein FliO
LWSLLWAVVCTALVVGLAYWATKLVASGKWRGFHGRGKRAEQMEVLSRLTLGRDQRLVLVHCGGRYLLLGVTTGHVEMLTELSAEEAEVFMTQEEPPEPVQQGQRMDFSQALGLVLRQKREKR